MGLLLSGNAYAKNISIKCVGKNQDFSLILSFEDGGNWLSIKGDKKVSSIAIKDTENGSEDEINVDGVFLAIGHTPNVSFLDGLVELDEKGYIKTGFTTDTSTSVPGIFAAGDVADSVYRQAITAAGTGCQAAIDAERWLDN